jgi:hypothetical protein
MKKYFEIVKEYSIRIFETVVHYAIEIGIFAFQKAKQFIIAAWGWFLDLPLLEKLIIFNGIPAAVAAAIPVGHFEIFDSKYLSHNPEAHLAALLAVYMFFSILLRYNKWIFIGRIVFPLYYLIMVTYNICAPGAISKEPSHIVYQSYVINYIFPVIYIILSLLSKREER